MSTKQLLTGAQATIATLRAYGVNTIFGIPGVHTLSLYEAMREEPGLHHVLARHEQGVGFMAEGYARATGHVGVACTITGPGVTNIATPMASAYCDSIPLLVISSSLPRATAKRVRGELHELKNQAGVMEALAGWTRSVNFVEEIPEALRNAFRAMRQGRPRGAYLQIPLDLFEAQAEVEIPTMDNIEPLRPTQAALTASVQLLHSAQRPLIVAGAGVTAANANEQLAQLAELLQAPVLLGSKSHDVLPTDHPLALPTRGTYTPEFRSLVAASDLVLVVGSKLGIERTEDGRLSFPKTSIQIDIDPAEIGRVYPATVGMLSDARMALAALHETLSSASHEYTARTQEIEGVRQSLRLRTQRVFGDEAITLLDSVRKALPRDGIVVADMTMLGYASAQYFPVYEPRTFIHPFELCTIGCGLPLALGAKVAVPERPVVTLCGDGGFLLNVGELATAVQEQIPVIVILFNDSTYTAVKGDQRRRFPGHYIATDLVAPDYVALARAFGAEGVYADGPDALSESLSVALQRKQPTLIEVPLSPKAW